MWAVEKYGWKDRHMCVSSNSLLVLFGRLLEEGAKPIQSFGTCLAVFMMGFTCCLDLAGGGGGDLLAVHVVRCRGLTASQGVRAAVLKHTVTAWRRCRTLGPCGTAQLAMYC